MVYYYPVKNQQKHEMTGQGLMLPSGSGGVWTKTAQNIQADIETAKQALDQTGTISRAQKAVDKTISSTLNLDKLSKTRRSVKGAGGVGRKKEIPLSELLR